MIGYFVFIHLLQVAVVLIITRQNDDKFHVDKNRMFFIYMKFIMMIIIAALYGLGIYLAYRVFFD